MDTAIKIKNLLKIRGENQEILAEPLGVTRESVNRKVNNKQGINASDLDIILEYFNIDWEDFRKAKTYKELETLHKRSKRKIPSSWIPVINRAQCGDWVNFTDLYYPRGIAEREERAPTMDPNAFYVIATGDSMIGSGIKEGYLLLVEPAVEINNGNVVLARLDDKVTVKKYYKYIDHVILSPMNSEHQPIIITDEEDLPALRVYRITRFMGDL